MLHPRVLDKEKTVLVVVDLQEAFRHPINEFAQIVGRTSIAVRGFQILGLPVIITEQYPKGLGRTAEEILLALPGDFEVVEKTAFSSCGAAAFMEKLRESGANQVVLCGLETHVCVNQTAHDLLREGFQVHLLTDAVASRFSSDKEAGLSKMTLSGVVPASVEMVLFELMRDAGHSQFKEIQNLIR